MKIACWNVLWKRIVKKKEKKKKNNFWIERVIKRNGDKLDVKWKDYDSSFNSWICKKDLVYLSEHFPKQKSLGGNVKVELDLSNYATNLRQI